MLWTVSRDLTEAEKLLWACVSFFFLLSVKMRIRSLKPFCKPLYKMGNAHIFIQSGTELSVINIVRDQRFPYVPVCNNYIESFWTSVSKCLSADSFSLFCIA